MENYAGEAQAGGAWLPAGLGAVAAQSREFVPVLPAIGRAEQGGVFHSGVDRIRIGRRRFEMPNALELPRMLGAVVPLMSGERFPGLGGGVVHELVALAFGRSRGLSVLFARRGAWLCPSFAAVIGALNDLPEPPPAF